MARWAKGKHSKSICDRSGFKYNYRDMVKEPGTGYWVYKGESDGQNNAVTDPLNFAPRKKREVVALEFPRPDVVLSSSAVPDGVLLFSGGSFWVTTQGDNLAY